MKAYNVQLPVATGNRPLAQLEWLLFCGLLWTLGIALSLLTIVNLYFR